VAVLGHSLWRNHFGADPEILGQTIRLDDLPHTVVGVLPPNTAFPERDTDLWVPLRLNEAGADRISRAMSVVGRMAPGVTLSQTQAEMDALAKALAEEYPESNAATGAWVAPLQRELVRGSSREILILAGAVALLLLVTCANLMGLLLIRWTDRKADLAVRTAVGASRGSHLRLLLSETLLLGVAGGIGGLLVGAILTRITSRFIPPALSLEGATGISPWLVGITFAVSLLAAVLFGLGPAIGFSRASPAELLRQRRGGPTVLTRRTQGVLVVGEVALALALVVGSSLLLQSLRRLSSQELGFRPEGVLVARVEPPSARYSEPGALTGFYRDVLDRINTIPGVLDAGFVSYAPLAGGGGMIYYEPPGVEEREGPPDLVYIRLATTDLLDALGASLASGRSFEPGDQLGAPPVAVVNQAFASRYLGGRPSALGAELPLGGLDLSAQVVGLLEDIRYLGIDEEPWPEVWLHEAQIPTYTFFAPRDLVVRTAVDPLSLSGALRAEIEAVDRSLPLFNVRTLESVAGADLEGPRFQLSLFTGFAVVSLFLACLGVFAVVQYSVQTRRREIGLRVALGASAGRVVRGVVGHGMTLVLSGVGIGILCTLLLGRVMESLLYETSLRDPFAFLFTCVLVVGAGCAACFVPSRRATRLSPMTVLRDD
jgi:predicted permease